MDAGDEGVGGGHLGVHLRPAAPAGRAQERDKHTQEGGWANETYQQVKWVPRARKMRVAIATPNQPTAHLLGPQLLGSL